jgi:hypothetical protein
VQAARWEAAKDNNMIFAQTIEAEAHQSRGDGAVADPCAPPATPAASTLDRREPLYVDSCTSPWNVVTLAGWLRRGLLNGDSEGVAWPLGPLVDGNPGSMGHQAGSLHRGTARQ